MSGLEDNVLTVLISGLRNWPANRNLEANIVSVFGSFSNTQITLGSLMKLF